MNRREDTRTLVVERELPHPPGKVWRAITQRALLDEWLMSNDFQPLVGHKFTFRGTPAPHWDGVVACDVLEVEPCKRLSYSWGTSGGLRTVVTFTLTPTRTGTQLRMEQSGFRRRDEANYRGANYGWRKFFDRLAVVLSDLK